MIITLGFPCGSSDKESTCNVGDLGSIPGLGRSPREGKGYPLQYSGLENSMDHSPWDHKESDMTEWHSLTFIMVLFSFLRKVVLFSIMAAPVYIPTNSVWGSLCSTCCCCWVTKVCPTLGDPIDCSRAGLCHSLSPGVFPNSCPLNCWCHPTISSSVALFSFCLQSFPASGSFPISQNWE